MPEFNRRFEVDALVKWDRAHPDNAVRALLQHWAAPLSRKADGVRVAVRDGYLNVYRWGQSVAKVSMVGGVPRLAVHRAYVDNARREDRLPTVPAPAGYVAFDASPATAACVLGWIATAESYAGDEKIFVDRLYGHASGALDLEMALPADDLPGARRVAPRMDLVVARTAPDTPGAVRIEFWEAKCATNAELRARAPIERDVDGAFVGGPAVVGQLDRYRRWFAQSGRVEQVTAAYRRTAEILLALHTHFIGEDASRSDGAVPHARLTWQRLEEAETIALVLPPAIAICNRPPRESQAAQAAYGRAARSFAGAHRDKLTAAGFVVAEYPRTASLSSAADHRLPPLSPADQA